MTREGAARWTGRLQRRTVTAVAVTTASVLAVAWMGKAWADQQLVGTDVSLGVLTLRLAYNPGVAFGLGAGAAPGLVLALTMGISVILAAAVLTHRLPFFGGSLVLGGALANVIDRLPDGRVTDYLSVGWWPTFNLADVAIVSGAALLVLPVRRRRAARQTAT